jgi:hypothetical protein
MSCLRPPSSSYMTGTTYSSTILRRPVPTIIWHQLTPIKGILAPNAKAIGPVLVEM